MTVVPEPGCCKPADLAVTDKERESPAENNGDPSPGESTTNNASNGDVLAQRERDQRIPADYPGLIKPIHHIWGVGSDPNDTEDEIPRAFVVGCQHNMTEARRRWQVTKKWRAEYQVDSILTQPQPHYELIKKYYPHAVHRCSRTGNWIYMERPGHGRLDKLLAAGLTMTDLERHYTFVTEYLWRVIDPREDGQIISIFDVEKCKLTDLAGDTLKLFKRCTALVGAHYPERSSKIFVINAPWYASAGWNMISPFLDARTSNKVNILRGSYKKALGSFCDPEDLPPLFEGKDIFDFGDSPVERDIRALVRKLNGEAGVESTKEKESV